MVCFSIIGFGSKDHMERRRIGIGAMGSQMTVSGYQIPSLSTVLYFGLTLKVISDILLCEVGNKEISLLRNLPVFNL